MPFRHVSNLELVQVVCCLLDHRWIDAAKKPATFRDLQLTGLIENLGVLRALVARMHCEVADVIELCGPAEPGSVPDRLRDQSAWLRETCAMGHFQKQLFACPN